MNKTLIAMITPFQTVPQIVPDRFRVHRPANPRADAELSANSNRSPSDQPIMARKSN
jgi:hypothetical protein